MIIILDSNIWLKELGLNSQLGAATRFFINKNRARLAIPEVVRLEVEHKFRTQLKEFVNTIWENHRQLLSIFGSLKEVILPTDEEIETKVQETFTNLGIDLIEIPFSFESAKNSFIKTIEKTPPSHKSQQFKDGVIWADCCKLLEDDDVNLVTSDKVFYELGDYSKGLAKSLYEETLIKHNSIKLFPSLSDLLENIKTEVVLDDSELVNSYLQQRKEGIEGILNRNGFQLSERTGVSRELYITETPNLLFIKFKIEFECEDITEENRKNGKLILKGSGSYNVIEQLFSELQSEGEELSFRLEDGSDRVIQNYVLRVASIVLGHKEVIYTVRYKLE